MSKRETNADKILNDSAMRLDGARIRVQTACSQLNAAELVFEAMQEAHNALEKELAPMYASQDSKETSHKRSSAKRSGE